MSASTPPRLLRVGTRGSALALAQASRVIALLEHRSGVLAEPQIVRTEGDVDKTSPLTVIGGRGVFTSALDAALLRRDIDAAVHSAKDLPSERPFGLALAAFPEREDARDVLVSRHRLPLALLPPRPTIGTSSRRRAMQVRLCRPDAVVVELRGNVDTRLRKALESEVDAIVLAAAGVRRMGWHDQVTENLPLDLFVPSPGQGALAVEVRADDHELVSLVAELDDPRIARAVRVERAFLRAVGGGCTAPIGAHAAPDGDALLLRAMLGSDDGRRVVWAEERVEGPDPETVASEVARRLLADLRAGRGDRIGAGFWGVSVGSSPVPAPAPAPLADVSVLVTRPRAQAMPTVAALEESGAEPVLLPTIRVTDPADPAPLAEAVTGIGRGAYDWIVFTSANAVARVLAAADRLAVDRAALLAMRVAAVGRATAAALASEGVHVEMVPEQSHAEGLVESFGRRGMSGARVLYPKAERARDTVPAGLVALGADVHVVDAYRTVTETEADPAVIARVARAEVDVVTFASPSAVHGLKRLVGEAWAGVRRAQILCVGPVTAAAARDAGLIVDAVADEPSTAGLIDALARLRADRGGQAARTGNGTTLRPLDDATAATGAPALARRGDTR